MRGAEVYVLYPAGGPAVRLSVLARSRHILVVEARGLAIPGEAAADAATASQLK